jgi:hypothetical protein
MIIVKLIGGLGNQLFQYALGRNLAEKHKTELKLDVSWFKKEFRNYELCYLNILQTIASEEEIRSITKMTTSLHNRLYRNLVDKVLPYYLRSQVVEKHNYFDPRILNAPTNSYLKGFWQSESYFKDVEGIIRKEFIFKTPLKGLNADLGNSMTETNSVSVHIRRGDYVSNPEFNKKHGTCHISYYEGASRYMIQQVPNPTYFIFSDDIQWVKQHVKCFEPCIYVTHNTGSNNYKDMQLMSLCKHNIIANSSFSWWAAWLNSNPSKVIVAPKKWFNDASQENQDMIPDWWVRL